MSDTDGSVHARADGPNLSKPRGSTAVRMRVEDMDCSACAIKIENALKRLPG